jgi:hypothetical protein
MQMVDFTLDKKFIFQYQRGIHFLPCKYIINETNSSTQHGKLKIILMIIQMVSILVYINNVVVSGVYIWF